MSTSPPAWIDITSTDASRSRAFYGELFGWQMHVEQALNYGIIAPTDTNLPGGIGQAGENSPYLPGVIVYFTVPDLDASQVKAEQLGGSLIVPPWDIPGLGRMAVLTDPDGNRIGLWQP